MSQSNMKYPPFECIVEEPTDQYRLVHQVPHLSNKSSQQWMSSPALHNIHYSVQDPSVSTRIASFSPSQRPLPCVNLSSTDITPEVSSIDPSLNQYMLAPSNYHEESWNTYHTRNTISSDVNESLGQPGVGFKQYRTGPRSVGSIAPESDSGYHSQSVLSNEPGRSAALTTPIANLNMRPPQSEAAGMIRAASDQISLRSHTSSRSASKAKKLRCAKCGEVSKCNSDFKKHQLKHNKPFLCKEPGCKRSGQGFTTVNDLDRHKKSVHRIGLLKKSYRCASASCRSREKIWPRLDNFKQHIERMHKEEDQIDLISKSVFEPSQPNLVTTNVAIAPLDTMLVGMDKSFSGQNSYAPTVGADMMATDHDGDQWPATISPTDFTVNLHQSNIPLTNIGHSANDLWNQHGQDPMHFQHMPRIEYHQDLMQDGTLNTSPDGVRNAGSGQSVAGLPSKKTRSNLSSGPQTKVEQQRQALKNVSQAFTKRVVESSPSQPVDLEQLFLSFLDQAQGSQHKDDPLHTQSGPASKVVLTKDVLMKASQMMFNLVKQGSGSAHSSTRAPPGSKVCHRCGYTVARECDLKKHMKRHDKPYGCTYPKCHKRFGAKSDWKRHENSQHFQQEAFRCAQKGDDGGVCGRHFFAAGPFERHLETRHMITSQDQREEEVKRRRIGKNCQRRFWCGFHKDIIELKEKRNSAWDERFDHIAYHFEKEKLSIDDWVCAEQNKTKKEIWQQMDRYVFDDDEERDMDADVGRDGSPLPPPLPPPVPGQTNKRKRPTSEDVLQVQRTAKREKRTTCCHCMNYFNPTLEVRCMNCDHICDSCETLHVLTIE